jgi:hypothetical protein
VNSEFGAPDQNRAARAPPHWWWHIRGDEEKGGWRPTCFSEARGACSTSFFLRRVPPLSTHPFQLCKRIMPDLRQVCTIECIYPAVSKNLSLSLYQGQLG